MNDSGQADGHDAPPKGPSALVVNARRFEWAPDRVVVVGRGSECDVVVNDARVSRRHLGAEATSRGWRVLDLGSRNGTFVDDEAMRERNITGPIRLALGAPGGPVLLIELAPPDEARHPRPAGEPFTLGGPVPARDELRPGGDAPRAAADEPRAGAEAPRPGAPPDLGPVVSVHRPGAVLRLGRSPDNDVVLADDPRASRHHAELRQRADGLFELRDLESHNGTFVNGARVSRALLSEDDVVSVGNHVFRFRAGRLEAFSSSDGSSLEVYGVGVRTADGLQLLEGVSFSVEAKSVVAVVGPSGAGKTTLLRALTGFSRPDSGHVSFTGRDFYDFYEELRARFGYVPQDDIVHDALTLRRELELAAALRLPSDLGARGFRSLAEEVMSELGLLDRADLQIERLSGGQRKRASVAIELLTKPALLYLDEPTSGLDPGNEQQMMSVLRRLADDGRIVVVVTHATQSLDLVDRVLFLAQGGHMAYFGPPDRALAYFARHGVSGGFAAVFRALEDDDCARWAATFRADEDYARYVGSPGAVGRRAPRAASPGPRRRATPVGAFRQLRLLSRRQVHLTAGDRRTLALLALQAPAFGIILTVLFPVHTFSTLRGPFAALLEWLLVVSATWLGASNTVREIVKETSIYRRERAAGLSITAYVGSKALVFGAITVVQAAVLLAIVLIRQHLPPIDPYHVVPQLRQADPAELRGVRPFDLGSVIHSQTLEVFFAMALAGLAGMALGLLISALVRRSDQAVFLLPVVLVVEMALSLPILQAQNPSGLLSTLGDLTSANWGMTAVASTTSLNQLMSTYQLSLATGDSQIRYALGHPYPKAYVHQQLVAAVVGDPQWGHTGSHYVAAVLIMAAMLAAFLVLTYASLRRIDPGDRKSPAQRAATTT